MRFLLRQLRSAALSVCVIAVSATASAGQGSSSPVQRPTQPAPAAPRPSAAAALVSHDTPTVNSAITARKSRDSVVVDSVVAAMKDETTRAAILSVIRSRAASQAEIDNGNNVFGIDVFRRETSLFDPNNAGPVPADYRIGPDDRLVLVLTGDVEEVHELPVTREGSVFIPNVGAVRVANLTMQELNDVLYTRLSRVYSGMTRGPGATAHFQVTVTNLGTNQVSVLGEVQAPGAYKISKLGTVLTALYSAGGPTEGGSLRQIRVMRGGTPVASVDLYDYLISGSTAHSVRLESGDVVLVPTHGPRIRLAGAVNRPATYELVNGETMGDLIRMGGGLRAEADRRRVLIERVVPPARRTVAGKDHELLDVSVASLETSREPLVDGDVVHVSSVAGRVANRVQITGNVWSGGAMALVPGMKLSDALAKAGGIKSDTYEALQISRLQPDQTRRIMKVHVPGVAATLTDPDILGSDVELQPDDDIRVYSLSEYRPSRTVSIGGAVKHPQSVPYVEGMTMRDLVMLAGGLDEGALLTEAEVARMPDDRSHGATATVVRVSLDSTYLLERRPDGTYLGPPGLAGAARGAPSIPLKPYDQILILRQPDFALPRVVAITGEVRYPGNYTLRTKSERLSDLIERAGGLTADAFPDGIVFTRNQGGVGRIGVDLPGALKDKQSDDNLLLVDGDAIQIPVRSAVVRVAGAVNAPVAVPYVSGADIDYYVYAAGGASEVGDPGKSYVTQPNGKVQSRHARLFWTSKPTPMPGSTIQVPEKKEGSHFDPAALLAATTSILTSSIAIIAILRR